MARPSETDGSSGSETPLGALIDRISRGEDLTVTQAESAFDRVMEGEASPVQMSALLVGLRTKGVVPSEVAGGVRALQTAMIPVGSDDPDVLVDTCGTGGGEVTTFNISTAAALVAAGAGVRIAKHGNRSFTSRSGSADVLEALGVRIEMSPGEMQRVLAEAGIVFMFAPLLHPAMRHVGPVRRELKISTIMNLLGPLTNPAGARRQVVGVADPALLGLIARALEELGHHRALVVYGEPGMDELSPCGPTRIAELAEGSIAERTVTPEALGVDRVEPSELAGGSPEQNAEIIRRILSGEDDGGAETAVLLNAAAALVVAEVAPDLEEGVGVAREAIASGAALQKLEALRNASHDVAD